jgi:hypothetical protein
MLLVGALEQDMDVALAAWNLRETLLEAIAEDKESRPKRKKKGGGV